jgi:ComF family protein
MIRRLKYRGRTGYASILAQLLEKYLKNLNLKLGTYTVVPIPLSKKRLGERGYNQAAIIAKLMAERFRLNFEEGALIRVKDAKAQMEVKSWDDRKANIAGCFGITDASLINKKNIILIDDVFTSGSTISEAVRTLKAAGAGRIIALTVAKAG